MLATTAPTSCSDTERRHSDNRVAAANSGRVSHTTVRVRKRRFHEQKHALLLSPLTKSRSWLGLLTRAGSVHSGRSNILGSSSFVAPLCYSWFSPSAGQWRAYHSLCSLLHRRDELPHRWLRLREDGRPTHPALYEVSVRSLAALMRSQPSGE